MNSVRSNNLILKYQVCKALGRKDVWITNF